MVLLGLEALITEVGGVFGQSGQRHTRQYHGQELMLGQKTQPLPMFTNQILLESVDISPSFAKYYRSRVVARVGEDDDEVANLDMRTSRNGVDWLPDFA